MHPFLEDVPLVKLRYTVFTYVPGESYHRRLGSSLMCSRENSLERGLLCA